MDVVYKLAESNEEIKNWVESHEGTPAIIDDPEIIQDNIGIRIDWKGKKDEGMLSSKRNITRDISWEEFFSIMDKKDLVFMYSDSPDVNLTWAYKFVNKFAQGE